MTTQFQRSVNPYWLVQDDCCIDEFAKLVNRTTTLTDYPLAAEVRANVPVYDCEAVRRSLTSMDEVRKALLGEWGNAFMHGPGLIVLSCAFNRFDAVEGTTRIFQDLIAEQHAQSSGGGDHFAKPGANDRIWNALEKLCLRDPAVFAAYYANDMIALVSEAWLGPAYQITSQVNVVNPGGDAQLPHRDYHLGFQTPDLIEHYPAHVHRLSPVLTLQGAVAHCDMPLESGPTLYLPYSQTYEPGYLAWQRPEFREYFDGHRVQLPLNRGDAVFFNPALFHAAGSNRSTDIYRIANLLQISSAYGRAMESVDRVRMSIALYPTLRLLRADGQLSDIDCANAVAACAEGYSFPTNLDRDPPLGGLAPQTQQALMLKALHEDWDVPTFGAAIEAQAWRRAT
jgi:ectoine hydroxylase-related dioxygenase (phytanoyl-CoA dioxygenase family)